MIPQMIPFQKFKKIYIVLPNVETLLTAILQCQVTMQQHVVKNFCFPRRAVHYPADFPLGTTFMEDQDSLACFKFHRSIVSLWALHLLTSLSSSIHMKSLVATVASNAFFWIWDGIVIFNVQACVTFCELLTSISESV